MNTVAGHAPARRISFVALTSVSGFTWAVAYVATLLFAAVPHLFVQDTWLTLVAGREVVQHGLPSVDHLTVFAAGRSWVDQQWLAQAIFYGADAAAGLKAVALVQLVGCVAAFAMLMRIAYARGASAPAVALVSVAAIFAAPWGLQVRAQGLAIPLFAAVIALLLSDQRGEHRRTWLVFPLLCIWANVHGSVVLGALLVVLYGALTWRRSVRSAAFVLLSPLTVLASPYVRELPAYYHLMLVDPPFKGLNLEWQRTTPRPITAVFFALALLVVATVVWRRRRFTRIDIAVLVVTLVSALLAVRGIVWFGLACVALLPAALSRRPWRAGSSRLPQLVAAAGACVLLAVSAVSFLTSRVDTVQTTALADAAARAAGPNGTIFADDKRADWLLWRRPDLRGRVAYDVRFELLRRSEIKRLSEYVYFDRREFPGITASFPVVVGDRKHVARVARERGLRIVYSGDDGMVAAAMRRASA